MNDEEKKEIEKQLKAIADRAVKKFTEIEEQKQYVQKQAMKDKSLVEKIAHQAVIEKVESLLYASRHERKQRLNNKCANTYIPTHKGNKKTIRTYQALSIVRDILDTYVCGAKAIGDCTFAEVRIERDRHLRMAVGNQEQANIYSAVLQKGKGNTLVRSKMKGADLVKIINREKKQKKVI